MKNIGIGLIGFGTVGAGVAEGLQRNGDIIADRLGARPVLRKIVDLDIDSDRGVAVDRSILTTDTQAVLNDPNIEIVIELIGGTGVAKDIMLQALDQGKHVVTANKAALAEHGEQIFGLAAERNTDIYFGASVGGGIPIIRALREGLVANRIESIYGILNGTCNYILTRMETDDLPFDDALTEAQAKGYAEADPALDIDAFDTAHKAVILASLAHGSIVPMHSVHIEGIRGLSKIDIQYALDMGYRVKLLAVIKRQAGDDDLPESATSIGSQADPGARDANVTVEVRVHPTLVPVTHLLASVNGVFNAVMVRGDMTGDTLYYGRGAGRAPTASTVISDIADIVRNIVAGSPGRVPAMSRTSTDVTISDMANIETRYYLRLSLLNHPGVLARISSILGKHGISIASVLQKEGRVGKHIPAVIVTHTAGEKEFNGAIEEISAMDIVDGEPVCLRIEE